MKRLITIGARMNRGLAYGRAEGCPAGVDRSAQTRGGRLGRHRYHHSRTAHWCRDLDLRRRQLAAGPRQRLRARQDGRASTGQTRDGVPGENDEPKAGSVPSDQKHL